MEFSGGSRGAKRRGWRPLERAARRHLR